MQNVPKTQDTLFHYDLSKSPEEPMRETVNSVTHVPQPDRVLLMTCRVKVSGPDESVIRARIFLDRGAARSFVTETLTQQLKLLRCKDNLLIAE